MKSTNTYLLSLYVKKCRINLNESGTVGLLLRAGKSQSHVTDFQPIVNGVITFNTNIKLNIDDSALDTQRCSLTLNFISAGNSRRVIGIVVINLPEVGEQVEKTFKVTSTPDKQAEIQLTISVNQLDDNFNIKHKIRQKQVEKQSEKQKQDQSSFKKFKSFGEELLAMTAKGEEKPTSPPSQSTQKLNLKSKRSQLESIVQHDDLISTIQKLQRQKQLLKQLLRLQTAKCQSAYNHLKTIVEVLQSATGIQFGPSPQQTPLRSTIPGEQVSSIIKKGETIDFNKFTMSLSSPGMMGSGLGIVKESKFEDLSVSRNVDSRMKCPSHVSNVTDRSVDLMNVLQQIKKKMEDNGQSKDEVRKMFTKIQAQPHLQIDAGKARILKTKIDRSYLGILAKQHITKEEILKHKIDINKILDQTINPPVK